MANAAQARGHTAGGGERGRAEGRKGGGGRTASGGGGPAQALYLQIRPITPPEPSPKTPKNTPKPPSRNKTPPPNNNNKQRQDLSGKAIAIWLPISAFAAVGFEHCIANM